MRDLRLKAQGERHKAKAALGSRLGGWKARDVRRKAKGKRERYAPGGIAAPVKRIAIRSPVLSFSHSAGYFPGITAKLVRRGLCWM